MEFVTATLGIALGYCIGYIVHFNGDEKKRLKDALRKYIITDDDDLPPSEQMLKDRELL